MNLTPQNYSFLVQLLKKRSGQVLLEGKDSMIRNRFSGLLARYNLSTVNALIDAVKVGSIRGIEDELAEAMAVHETYFFRDTKLFDFFQEIIMPELLTRNNMSRIIRMWSAACSSGQEIYSLAMILEEMKTKLEGWSIRLLGSDFSARVVQQARDASFSQFEVQRGLPVTYLVKYFQQQGNQWKIAPLIKDKVTFKLTNLTTPLAPESVYLDGPFDVIFCRNVLIYFDQETKSSVMNNLVKSLNEEGYLILGASETIMGLEQLFPLETKGPGIYKKKKAE